MRNIKLSTPDRDSLAGDTVTLENKRKLIRVIDETYFKVELGAGYCSYEGAAVDAKNGDALVMQFPAGAATRAYRHVVARQLWVGTRPRIEVWYSAPGGSVTPFNMGFVFRCFGVASSTVNVTGTLDWTPAGPAAAGTVMYTTAVMGATMPSSPFGVVQIRLTRNRLANDANVNALDVLLAVVTFEERP